MDPQETADEEDAGMEELERSAQGITPERLPWGLPESLYTQLAQFGQSDFTRYDGGIVSQFYERLEILQERCTRPGRTVL